jgi:hypothetical protein
MEHGGEHRTQLMRMSEQLERLAENRLKLLASRKARERPKDNKAV